MQNAVLIFVFLLCAAFTHSAHAQSIHVIDGNTLIIDDRTHRLHGIDAPEFAQICKDGNGEKWPCGEKAAENLRKLVVNGAVTCVAIGRDYYGRSISKCKYYGKDLNARLVREGWAWAFRRYSSEYIEQEDIARGAGLGIWQANNLPAEVFRDQSWQLARELAPDACPIKGSKNAQQERIYVMPWDKDYAKTHISLEKGERWFCDEGEARSAGWRAVRN